ncbi:MAG: hypothetical protein O3B13_09485 [Planctomycetota bacterium]|nr:hypothetical protein [Planctomycetota bacterium]
MGLSRIRSEYALNNDISTRIEGKQWSISQSLEKLAEQHPRRQILYSQLVYDYKTLACLLFAGGFDLADVRKSLALAAKACLRVFELRGTEPNMPILHVTVPTGDGELKKEWEPPHIDYSMTNSRDNLEGTCDALSSGAFLLAAKVATLAWDPPDAGYMRPGKYQICTPHDVRLANALQRLLHEDPDACREELAGIRTRPTAWPSEAVCLQGLIESILDSNEVTFREWMFDLLDWHARESRKELHKDDPDSVLCLTGLGLSSLAIHRGCLSISDLPNDNPFLPLELVELAQQDSVSVESLEFQVIPINS